MSVNLDTSVVASLTLTDANSSRATALATSLAAPPSVSTWVAAEFASTVSRLRRTGTLADDRARDAIACFGAWAARVGSLVAAVDGDVVDASRLVRDASLNLRAPDALHLAICRRLGATLATFDQRMAVAARSLGIAVVT